MTISIDSIWILLGVAGILGFGGYLGVYYAVLFLRASTAGGGWMADKIIWPLFSKAYLWVKRWKN
ncbi:hypothetical protein NLN82_22690 [Citrobacter portucalensis]|uniref:hypothetical protein n=1 Tax=Citrobacter portucalensis TaxID=1639133 RepID=UPI00226B7355|nr:hypothetical protein [Citrobacter portucalensis]MCX9038835.1 hypothetical protein [Citrobacter portucalensis]